MSEDPAVFPAGPAPEASLPGALPFVDFSAAVNAGRDAAYTIALLEGIAEKVQALVDQHRLLQGQMIVMERQLDAISLIVMKTGKASLPAEALKVTEADVNESTKKYIEKQEEEIQALIDARGGDHPPTPEEIAAAAAENMR